MDISRAESIGKRYNECGRNSLHLSNKRQKLDPAEKSVHESRITDVVDDCLTKIFELLDFESLLNVAVSNRRLQAIAGSVYRRKYCTKRVFINPYSTYAESDELAPTVSLIITHSNLNTCFQFLRCFGDSISKMNISYPPCIKSVRSKHYAYVDQYINLYCADSLTSVRYEQRPAFRIETMKKPFSKVESLCIERSNLDEQLPQFLDWFPNLRRLKLFANTVNRRYIEVSFPHLEHLSVEMSDNEMSAVNFSKKNLADFLRVNSQLKSVEILMDLRKPFKFDELLPIIENNPSISKLSIPFNGAYRTLNGAELSKLAALLPSIEELHLPRYLIGADDAVNFMSQLKLLKVFNFVLNQL